MDRPIQPGTIARISGGLRSLWNQWFPPLEPLPQVAPEGTPTRRFDYMVGENIQIQPRLERFLELRALADGYDLMRIVIETFKDHLVKVPWIIRPVTMPGQKRPKEGNDPRVAKLTQLLSFPDGEQPWSAWLRALLEDALVIDAPVIEPILSRGGDLVRLDLIDGATITPKIGYDGRIPKPPEVAYQQIVKGAPTVEFTADELIYYPRNRRTHKIYGYSPVEQILLIANLAVRREMWLLNFFTEGSIPEAYLGLSGEFWTPDQMKTAQDSFDSYLSGNLRNRRKVIVGPDGKFQLLKADAIGGDAVLDELIIRMICFAFNVSPQALVKMMNRATAQTAKAQAAEEGLIPWMMYVQELMNLILRKYCKVADLEFAWQDEKEEDPTAQANNIKTLVSIAVISPNEGRDMLGLDPVEGGDQCMVYTATGPVPLSSVQQSAVSGQPNPDLAQSRGDAEGDTAQAAQGNPATVTSGVPSRPAKQRHSLRASAPLREIRKAGKPAPGSYAHSATPAQRAAETRLNHLFKNFLGERGSAIAEDTAAWYASHPGATQGRPGGHIEGTGAPVKVAQVCGAQRSIPGDFSLGAEKAPHSPSADVGHLAKADDKPPFDQTPWDQLAPEIRAELEIGFREAMQRSLDSLNIDDAGIWGQIQPRAVSWAKARAGDLISQVADTTREGIQELVEKALTDGLSPQQLKSAIQESALFDSDRAEMIARTELAKSHTQGTLSGWKDSGLVTGYDWVCDTMPCPECQTNAEQGTVAIGELFESGDDGPPAHPNCECALSPVLRDEQKLARKAGGSYMGWAPRDVLEREANRVQEE